MFELYLALVVPRFTEALRDRRALVIFLGESLVGFRAKDCSVVATILPSTDPILRDVVTSRLWLMPSHRPSTSQQTRTVRFGLFFYGGYFLWLQVFERFVASYSFPPTNRLPEFSCDQCSPVQLLSLLHACGPGEAAALDLPADRFSERCNPQETLSLDLSLNRRSRAAPRIGRCASTSP